MADQAAQAGSKQALEQTSTGERLLPYHGRKARNLQLAVHSSFASNCNVSSRCRHPEPFFKLYVILPSTDPQTLARLRRSLSIIQVYLVTCNSGSEANWCCTAFVGIVGRSSHQNSFFHGNGLLSISCSTRIKCGLSRYRPQFTTTTILYITCLNREYGDGGEE